MGFISTGLCYDHRKWRKRRIQLPPESLKTKKLTFQNKNRSRPIHDKLHLETLPPEILYNIFCHVNIKENNLPLVNKYFNELFTIERFGYHYTEKLIKSQFLVNLNKNWIYLIPYLEKLIENFNTLKINSVRLKNFLDNFELFCNVKYGLNHDVFKYKFGYEIPLKHYKKYLIASGSKLTDEANHRHKYIRFQIERLNKELSDYRRQQEERQEEQNEQDEQEVDFDELSRMADRLFQNEPGVNESEPATNQPEPGTDPTTQTRENTEEDNGNNRNNGYELTSVLQLTHETIKQIRPKFPKKFKNINSMTKFHKIKVLLYELGFMYDDLNEVIMSVLNSKLTIKHKSKVIHFLLKTYLDPKNVKVKFTSNPTQNPLLIKSFILSQAIILRVFEVLIECNYDQKFQPLVHHLLEIFYGRALYQQLQEQPEIMVDDYELWNLVKESKQSELFQILCQYSTPNFSL